MTNAQKYEEVFGLPPDKRMCPTGKCECCPVLKMKSFMELCSSYTGCIYEWWDSEYNEQEVFNGQIDNLFMRRVSNK